LEVSATRVVTPADRSQLGVSAIAGRTIAKALLVDIPQALDRMRSALQVTDPIAVSAAFVGMRGSFLVGPGDSFGGEFGYALDRDFAGTPWFVVSPGEDMVPVLRSVADALWQSAGYPTAPEFSVRS
jgi:hypothetical protein